MKLTALTLATAIAATGANAGEMEPIYKYLERTGDKMLMTYVFDRCSALYLTMAARAGVVQLGQEGYDRLFDTGLHFMNVSAFTSRQKYDGKIEDWMVAAGTNISQISTLYNDMMISNFAETGAAFGDLIRSDMEICKATISIE